MKRKACQPFLRKFGEKNFGTVLLDFRKNEINKNENYKN